MSFAKALEKKGLLSSIRKQCPDSRTNRSDHWDYLLHLWQNSEQIAAEMKVGRAEDTPAKCQTLAQLNCIVRRTQMSLRRTQFEFI